MLWATLESFDHYSKCIEQWLHTFGSKRRRKKCGVDGKHVCTLLGYDLLHWQRTSAGCRTMDLFSAFFNRINGEQANSNFVSERTKNEKIKSKPTSHAVFLLACLHGWSLAVVPILSVSKTYFFPPLFGANTTNVLVLHFTAGLLSLLNSKLIRSRYLSRCSDRSVTHVPMCMWVAGSLFCYFPTLRSFYFVRSSITPLHSTIFFFFKKKYFSLRSLFILLCFTHSLYLSSAQTAIVLSRSLAVCGVFSKKNSMFA